MSSFLRRILLLFSALLVSFLPLYYATNIRGMTLTSFDNLLLFGLVSLVSVLALTFAYHNLQLSQIQQMHKKETSSAGFKIDGEIRRRYLEKLALAYSLAVNNTLCIVSFLLLAVGVFARLPAYYNYLIAAATPPVMLAYLTSPRV